MDIKFNNIALTGNFRDSRAVESVQLLANHLARRCSQVTVSDRISIGATASNVRQSGDEALVKDADLIIAVGGDGAMLYGARQAAAADIPLLGINRGRLGFLADVSPDGMLDRLDQILRGQYDSEKRMLLQAEIVSDNGSQKCGIALNDIVIKRNETGRMLEFLTAVDGKYVNTHGGDGFIIASPTGSTAYALSCGGPIVAPDLDAIVLAPICPHTLSDRPIVIPGTSITEVRLKEEHSEIAEVICDGEVKGKLGAGDHVRVAAADRRVELIHPHGYDYFEILRGKLHWGRGNRSNRGNS
jgi:NAD+ kinase